MVKRMFPVILLLSSLPSSPSASQSAGERVVVRPADTGAALVNPCMGWVLHFYDNIPANYGSRLAPSDTVDDYPGLAVVYLRLPWSMVEPEEGRYRWEVVDGPAQRWIARGKQVAFRFTCCESWMRYATPEWVRRAGARGFDFEPGKGEVEGGPYWEPDYDDPVFLAKLDHFLAAAAARYDGNPTVAWVDVGSFGVWGEGHVFASTQRKYSASTIIRHIDLHRRHFRRTLLAANDDFSFQGEEPIEHARQHGLTLRDDSILVQPGEKAYFHSGMAHAFWPRLPVILESEHYGPSRDLGFWQDGALYLQAVEDYHASYASIHWWPREFLQECRPLIDKMNQRLGYRLQLVEASWQRTVARGAPLRLSSRWRNGGVAPCYPGGCLAWTLKDKAGGIVTVLVDDALQARDLAPGAPGAAPERSSERTYQLADLVPPGTYTLCVSIGSATGTPRIALPLPRDDGSKRYPLGELVVTGDYDARSVACSFRDGELSADVSFDLHVADPDARGFLHLERGGTLVAAGGQDTDAPVAGRVRLRAKLHRDAAGTFELKLGLWRPSRIGQPDERLWPDRGEADRRIAIGRLIVGPSGDARFEPAS